MRVTDFPKDPVACIKYCVELLLDEEIIENTITPMMKLEAVTKAVSNSITYLSAAEKESLKCLERLYSESIRMAIHKSELGITNRLIRNKNAILQAIGITPDEFHQEIKPEDYDYNW
jgi:hypothetical protein